MKLRAIGYKNDDPIVMFTDDCWNMSCKQPGSDVEYLRTALKLAGYEAEVLHIDDSIDDTIQMISDGKADISVHAIRQTIDRMKDVDFSIPINYLVYGYLAREVEEFQVEDYILRSLSINVYALLFGSILLSGVTMFLLSRPEGNDRFTAWIWHSMKVLIKQPSSQDRYNSRTAVFMVMWTWFCFMFTLYYESSMKSYLMLSSKKGFIFQNLEGVINAVENLGWTIVTQERGWDPFFFCDGNKDQCDRLKKLEPRFIRLSMDEDIEVHLAKPRMVSFVGAHLDHAHYDVSVFNRKKKILFIRDTGLAQEMLAFAINKNLTTVRSRLNTVIAKMGSAYENFSNRYASSLHEYNRHDSSYLFYTLPLLFTLPVFKLVSYLIALAITTFILELVFHHFHIKKRVLRKFDVFARSVRRIPSRRRVYSLD